MEHISGPHQPLRPIDCPLLILSGWFQLLQYVQLVIHTMTSTQHFVGTWSAPDRVMVRVCVWGGRGAEKQ